MQTEIQKTADKIRQLIRKAKYRQALPIATKLFKKFPNELYVRHLYANILADASIYTDLPNRPQIKKKAIALFRKLLRHSGWPLLHLEVTSEMNIIFSPDNLKSSMI